MLMAWQFLPYLSSLARRVFPLLFPFLEAAHFGQLQALLGDLVPFPFSPTPPPTPTQSLIDRQQTSPFAVLDRPIASRQPTLPNPSCPSPRIAFFFTRPRPSVELFPTDRTGMPTLVTLYIWGIHC